MSRATDLLAELVRADTVAGREQSLAEALAGHLDAMTHSWAEFEEGRAQLVSRAGGDQALTFTGHLDTVPATPSDWSVDPWSAEVDGDRMVGRGTSDMKSGVAALVVAISEHLADGHECRGVQVVLTSGEETGCEGAVRIPADLLVRGGPLVVAEPTANRLVPAHKGAHWMRLTAHGRAAHGSAPELGDNAAVRLARAAVALHDKDDWPHQEGFGHVTANVGLLRGGVQPNVVPDSAEMLLDVRTVPDATGDTVRDLVRSLAGEGVEVDDHVVLPPVDTDVADDFVATVGGALADTGLEAAPAEPARYFTDASALAPLLSTDGRPVPTVILGPGEPDQCHVADEWCSMSKVDTAVEVYAALLRRWCTG